jgi:cystathionine beta-lyase/cystathionine gamma-synthase
MARAKKDLDVSTLVVHAGERRPVPTGLPVSTPVYTTATFTYDSMEEVDKVFAGEKAGYVYTRYGNPTVAALEEAISTLEGGAGACAFSSGMAALHAAIFACEPTHGSTVLASQDLYGSTLELLYKVFGPLGIKTVTADFSNLDDVRSKASEHKPRILLIETISNPLLKVCDIEACAEIAKEIDAKLIVDSTFTPPYLCQPLKFGADIVVHSATKYLGGHADTMGGITIVRDEIDLNAMTGIMKLGGGILGVWEAHEILRGLKTLVLRLERQCTNASQLAEHLTSNPKISQVFYPKLAGTKEQEIVARMIRSPFAGAIVSIELKEKTQEAAFKFMNALQLCVRLTSLGDVFTGVLHPATASHREMAPARRRQLGISDGLVRISVGIENVTDIINDIDQALNAV